MKDYVNELKVFISGVFISLSIDFDIANALVTLMTLDLIFGVSKALYLKELTFDFKTLFRGLIIKLLILLITMVTALTAKGLGFQDFKFLVTLVMKLFIIAETFSIYNSFLSIKQNKVIHQTDLISSVVEKIQNFMRMQFDRLLGSIDNKNINNE